jgi:hypothetical protein
VLHTRLHLHVAGGTRRINGRNLGTIQKAMAGRKSGSIGRKTTYKTAVTVFRGGGFCADENSTGTRPNQRCDIVTVETYYLICSCLQLTKSVETTFLSNSCSTVLKKHFFLLRILSS